MATNWEKREVEKDQTAEKRGLVRLPDSAYGPHVVYVMIPIVGLKGKVRISVTRESYEAKRASLRGAL